MGGSSCPAEPITVTLIEAAFSEGSAYEITPVSCKHVVHSIVACLSC